MNSPWEMLKDNPTVQAEFLALFDDEKAAFIGPDLSVSGLSSKAVPKENCIVDQFEMALEKGRIVYLVTTPNLHLHAIIRIADAYPNSGYDRFCVVSEISDTLDDNQGLADIFVRWKSSLSA